MQPESKFWPKMFLAAALFNFIIAIPIIVAPRWSLTLAYIPSGAGDDTMTLRFWGDFGFVVLLIGIGYYLVSRDITQNHGIVLLGILGKLFDVAVLTYRFALGVANPIVIIPAVIDGIFVILFILFLYQFRSAFVVPSHKDLKL